MKISSIEQIPVDIPYKDRVSDHLQKGWGYANRATDEEFQEKESEYRREWEESSPPAVKTNIYHVHTDEGLTGIAEGADVSEEKVQDCIGRNPFEFILDDSVGPLQMALYDLMGQSAGLPMAQLLGPAKDTVPLACWSQCFPPEVLQQEARLALAEGYTIHKFKRRAHTDVLEQASAVVEVVPEHYEITIDANCTFGTKERAIETGRKLKQIPQVKCLESPIDQEDVEGYLAIKKDLDYPLAIHYGSPSPVKALHSEAYDYFVLGGRAGEVMRQAHFAEVGGMPFWLQMGFTGLSAIFMIHLAAAIPNATLGHVSLFRLLEHSLLREPIKVHEGQASVPDLPGIGVELDMDAVENYRVG